MNRTNQQSVSKKQVLGYKENFTQPPKIKAANNERMAKQTPFIATVKIDEWITVNNVEIGIEKTFKEHPMLPLNAKESDYETFLTETNDSMASSSDILSANFYGESSTSFSEIPRTLQMSADFNGWTRPLQESPSAKGLHFLHLEDSQDLVVSSTSLSFVSSTETNEEMEMASLQMEESDDESDIVDAVQPPPQIELNISKRNRPDTDASFLQVYNKTYFTSFCLFVITIIYLPFCSNRTRPAGVLRLVCPSVVNAGNWRVL